MSARRLLVLATCLVVWCCADVTSASDDVGALETVLQHLSQRVGQLEARADRCDSELQELKKLQPSVIFSVQHSQTDFDIDNHVTIPFDVVLVNRGAGYSGRHGEFTAPVSGLYYLSYRGWSRVDQAGFLQLVLNDHMISELPFGDSTHESASSQSLVQHLNHGDVLSIAVYSSGTIKMMGGDRTTFMGYLILAD